MFVTPVEYTPPSGHSLDVEIVRAAELRTRVAQVPDRGVERIDFYVLIVVTSGVYQHVVDFDAIDATAGSCVLMRPGQVHAFGPPTPWEGWMLIFTGELLLPPGPVPRVSDLEQLRYTTALPTHIRASGDAFDTISASLEQMTADLESGADPKVLHGILRAEITVLLLRLHLLGSTTHSHEVDGAAVERFRDLRDAVERDFRQHRGIAHYARRLGCSTRSLNRATRLVVDRSAKAFIVDRVVLEARRLLAHTLIPVALVSDQLGFDEPTNFVKFFKRETGRTPGAFRKQSRAPARNASETPRPYASLTMVGVNQRT